MVTNAQKTDQALLQRLFPDVKVSEKLVSTAFIWIPKLFV